MDIKYCYFIYFLIMCLPITVNSYDFIYDSILHSFQKFMTHESDNLTYTRYFSIDNFFMLSAYVCVCTRAHLIFSSLRTWIFANLILNKSVHELVFNVEMYINQEIHVSLNITLAYDDQRIIIFMHLHKIIQKSSFVWWIRSGMLWKWKIVIWRDKQ